MDPFELMLSDREGVVPMGEIHKALRLTGIDFGWRSDFPRNILLLVLVWGRDGILLKFESKSKFNTWV